MVADHPGHNLFTTTLAVKELADVASDFFGATHVPLITIDGRPDLFNL
jgi:hypothetical protein